MSLNEMNPSISACAAVQTCSTATARSRMTFLPHSAAPNKIKLSMCVQSVCLCVCALHREAGFRKRAQSADDDGSVALAESLQHLTLSEFLKEYVEGGGAAQPSVAPSASSF